MKNGGVVATVVKPADPGRAPYHNVLGQVHGNLPTQTRGRLVPMDASISEMIGYRRLNLFERQAPDPISMFNCAHQFLRRVGPHSPGQQTGRRRPGQSTRGIRATSYAQDRATPRVSRETFEDAHSPRSPVG